MNHIQENDTKELEVSNEIISELKEFGISPISKHINLQIFHHQRLGDGVTRTICKIENVEVVRINQVIYGKVIGEKATWRIGSNIPSDKIGALLENVFLAKAENTLIPFL